MHRIRITLTSTKVGPPCAHDDRKHLLANVSLQGCVQGCVHAAQGCPAAVVRRPLMSLPQAGTWVRMGPQSRVFDPSKRLGASSGVCSERN